METVLTNCAKVANCANVANIAMGFDRVKLKVGNAALQVGDGGW